MAIRGNLRSLRHDFSDGQGVFLADGDVDARHQREVESHLAFVAIAEVRAHIAGPLVGFGQHEAVCIPGIDLGAQPPDDGVSLRQVLAACALALHQIRNGVQTQRIHSHIKPETHGCEHFLKHQGIVEVQIGLMKKEAMPVVMPSPPGPRSNWRLRCRKI